MKTSGLAGCWSMLVALFIALPASAQPFPNKPLRMVVTSAPGGITDIMTRQLSEYFSRSAGQPMIIDNRPGAGGALAMELVSKAAPDGYTLVMGTIGTAPAVVALFLYALLPIVRGAKGVDVADGTVQGQAFIVDKNGDVPLRPATTVEAYVRSRRFDLDDYEFSA